jgi:hypothetical protein
MCSNGLAIEKDLIERRLLAEIQEQVLRPEVVDYVVTALRKPGAENNYDAGKRLASIEQELGRLAEAVAVSGPTPALLTAMKQREQERHTLSLRKPIAAPRDVRAEALKQLSDIGGMLNKDTVRARAELARHTGPVVLIPKDKGYEVEGIWSLLQNSGELVAGVGFEPTTFGL